MKKEHIIRESRHIVAVFSQENKPTGYCIKGKSPVTEALHFLLKWNWAEKVDERDGFIYVRPTDTLLKILHKPGPPNAA